MNEDSTVGIYKDIAVLEVNILVNLTRVKWTEDVLLNHELRPNVNKDRNYSSRAPNTWKKLLGLQR